MANQEHLDIIKQSVDIWNSWREKYPNVHVDLSNANLTEVDLSHANLSGATLSGATLITAYLRGVNLNDADLREADLSGADLSGADLSHADLGKASLVGANLHGANLQWAILSEANFSRSNLAGCLIYAISAWNVQIQDSIQTDLIITREDEPTITVDNLEVAQFIYLLLNNQNIRDVIDSLTSKTVLVMGRFTYERKIVLDAIREELRNLNYLPILFDFEKPASRNISETFITLASLSRFIIVDITSPSSVIQELQAIVPTLAIPVQPLLEETSSEYSTFFDFRRYPWVLPVYRYENTQQLIKSLVENVITPAEQKARELEHIKAIRNI